MATPLSEAVSLARIARASAIVGVVPADAVARDMAAPGILRATGPDAGSFLHSQITNDVTGLQPGMGNLNARVARTGHLQHVFGLHCLPSGDGFRLTVGREHLQALLDDLDSFLFADDVTLAIEGPFDTLSVQGPRAADLCDAVFGPLGFEPWAVLTEGGLRSVRRTRKDVGIEVPEGSFAIRRSLGGDVGFVVFLPAGTVLTELADAFRAAGAEVLDVERYDAALDVLRIEAGHPRIGPETAGKKRLLPETGLEQSAVSYTKGCYLGQEVIARVRTYGSVPFLLRALVFPAEEAEALLARLPEPGADLMAGGKRVGVIASRTLSPITEAPVALAYLHRDHRTPGLALTLDLPDGPVTTKVAVLPLYSAPDSAAKVQQLYDRAVRTFADGDATRALSMLEEALQIDPGFGDAYEAIGVMLGRSGHFHEAIDVFRRLEEVAPDEPMVNTNLSLYYMKLGDKETAEDEAGKATLKSMASARGKVGAGATADEDLLKAKRHDAGRKRKMFQQVLEFDAVDPIALFGMGTALLTLGEPEEAAEYLRRAIEVDPKNSPVYAARGKALEKVERVAEAIEVYKAGVEVASKKGDLMPLKEMEHRLLLLGR